MITKLDIQEKDGFLTMKDFPMNCIFNKVKTGCGATTIALTNNENYIITVPTTELIENKCYPTKDADGNVKFWKFQLRAKEKIKGLLIFCWSKEDYLHL